MSELPTRLLRETLGARLAPASSSGCIDTETLAAWSDGTLSAPDRAAAESHAADCARCQALLAAMARTVPEAPSHAWWRPSVFGWLAPLAAAAVAIVVWINLPKASTQQAVAPALSSARAAYPDVPLPEVAQQASKPAKTPTDAADARGDASKAEAGAKTDKQRRAAAAGSAPRDLQEAERKAAPNTLRDAVAAPPASVPPLPRPEPVPPPPAAERSRTANVAAPPAAAPVTVTANPAGDASARAASGFNAQSLAKAVALPAEIVSPDPKVRWRIASNSTVLRSVDGGTTWQPQVTGVVATLTAGFAPSPATCWLVGAGGIVLLSTDGRTWQRVPFPEAVDLSSIVASDAANAIVKAADGRVFTTTDSGKTWRPKN